VLHSLCAFVDESWQDELGIFCAGILVVEHKNINPLEKDLENLVSLSLADLPTASNLELHGYDIFQKKEDWGKVALRKRIWIYKNAIRAICRRAKSFIVKPIAYKKLHYRDPHELSLLWGLERVQEEALNYQDTVKIIADAKPESETGLQKAFEYAQRVGTGGYRSSSLSRLDQTIVFKDSKESKLIQACDLALYICCRQRLNLARNSEGPSPKATAKIYSEIESIMPILKTFP